MSLVSMSLMFSELTIVVLRLF